MSTLYHPSKPNGARAELVAELMFAAVQTMSLARVLLTSYAEEL